MPPELPNGTQFLATTIANLYGELAAAFDQLKDKDVAIAEQAKAIEQQAARIAELEKAKTKRKA